MPDTNQRMLYLLIAVLGIYFFFLPGFLEAAGINLPEGTKKLEDLTAASTLLRMIDSAIFKFGARILAGLSVLAAGWNLKEQRFGMAIVCIFGAVVMGTVPMWIKGIFEIQASGGGSVFGG
ncbi:MAG: hypothetical protein AB8G05_05720 [Oligoflexales bacterium]